MGIFSRLAGKIRQNIVCSVMVLTISAVPAENAFAEPVVIAGSGSNLPAIRLLLKAFSRRHPEIRFAEPTNIGSAGAIQAAADGAISIGLISRPLLGNEKKLGLTMVPYARTAVVIGVNPSVGEENITYNELNSIYRGEKSTWKNGRKIIVLNREPGESSIYVLEENVPGFREVYADSIKKNRWTVVLKDEGMNQKIETLSDAIGFSDLGAITSQKLKIKTLKLNGISPAPKNVASGAYPLYKELYFIYRPENRTPDMQAFMSYVCSKEGKNILLKNGYTPDCVPAK